MAQLAPPLGSSVREFRVWVLGSGVAPSSWLLGSELCRVEGSRVLGSGALGFYSVEEHKPRLAFSVVHKFADSASGILFGWTLGSRFFLQELPEVAAARPVILGVTTSLGVTTLACSPSISCTVAAHATIAVEVVNCNRIFCSKKT